MRTQLAHILLLLLLPLLCSFVICNGQKNDKNTGKNDGQPPIIVETKFGKIEGLEIAIGQNRAARVFLGIPYAKPPLRFAKAEQLESGPLWSDTFKANKFGNRCQMVDIEVEPKAGIPVAKSEDCLNLNIMAPSWPYESGENKDGHSGFPVMFWIHGGGFIWGSSVEYGYEGISRGLVATGVVVVTINYRLGVFGFFSTGDAACPGNLGLWDQTLALKWVRENIGDFGGNGRDITVFGESAGGASTHYLSLSPHSRDMFEKMIAMSGTVSAPWAGLANTQHYSSQVAKILQCDHADSNRVIECLRGKSVQELLTAPKSIPNSDTLELLWFVPTVDGDFLPKHPRELRHEAPKKTAMTGTCELEGLLFASLRVDESTNKYIFGDNFGPQKFDVFLDSLFESEQYKNRDLLSLVAKHQYLSGGDSANNLTFLMYKYAELFGDYQEIVPTYKDVKGMLDSDWTVYLYSFEYSNPKQYFPGSPENLRHVPTHASELAYLFNKTIFVPFEMDKTDEKVSENIIALFSQFAKTGNPNNADSDSTATLNWQPLNKSIDHLYLRFGAGHLQMRHNYHRSNLNFWTKLVPEIEANFEVNKRQ